MDVESEATFESVKKRELQQVLWKWITGTLEDGDVVDYADVRLPDDPPEVGEVDRPLYIVLDALSTVFAQPLTREDGLVLLEFLTHYDHGPAELERALEAYWDAVDWDERLKSTSSSDASPTLSPSELDRALSWRGRTQ
ncbi:MAG: hypothetical protein ABEL76_00615 [Bradymonadaceae bacterium]